MIKIPKNELYSIYLFFLLSCLSIIFFLCRRYLNKKRSLKLKIDSLQERINLLSNENARVLKTKTSLQEKISRYSRLKSIIEILNQSLDIDFLSRSITEEVSNLIAKGRGSVLLYGIDEQTHNPVLFKSKKNDPHLVIRAKEGDIFDFWVLRHTSHLLVEDIKKDFRFDPEKLRAQDLRPVASLISAPLVSEHRLLGILRLDSEQPGAYSQDDLRLLSAVADLAAVALENAQIYAKTKDLAIHDALTGLYSKGYFLERLKEEAKRVTRQDSGFSLFMLDVDYFKKYNDKFGHSAGDIVLKRLAAILTDELKSFHPLICRFGGEEFCILLGGVKKDQAKKIAEQLCVRISQTKVVLRREEAFFNVSIGVASMFEDALSEDELIFKADKALLLAKEQGRNRVACA